MNKIKSLKISRLQEDFVYNYKLDYLTKFNIINNHEVVKFKKISLNFGFRNIKFEKKKMIPFFFILELISNQKSFISLSKKNILFLQLKKGDISGCKVTLRNNNLYEFLDTLLLALTKYENFKGLYFSTKNKKNSNLKISLKNLFVFNSIEYFLIYKE